jgi:hypothetical protein
VILASCQPRACPRSVFSNRRCRIQFPLGSPMPLV